MYFKCMKNNLIQCIIVYFLQLVRKIGILYISPCVFGSQTTLAIRYKFSPFNSTIAEYKVHNEI